MDQMICRTKWENSSKSMCGAACLIHGSCVPAYDDWRASKKFQPFLLLNSLFVVDKSLKFISKPPKSCATLVLFILALGSNKSKWCERIISSFIRLFEPFFPHMTKNENTMEYDYNLHVKSIYLVEMFTIKDDKWARLLQCNYDA